MKLPKKLYIGLLSITSILGLAITPTLAATTTVVYPGNMNGWAFAEEVPTGSGTLVEGPGTPPLGTGSAQLTVDSTGRELLYTTNYAGTRLDSISSLQYSTYTQSPTTGLLAPSLQFDVDYDLTDLNTAWQGRLVYEPYMNGTVTSGTWQTWNPLEGVWWASGAPGNTVCPQASPCTWAQVLAAFPNAGIRANVGNVNFKAGGPWTGGFVGNVDAFTFNNTTYDFETQLLVGPPTSKDQCKNDGWKSFNNPAFKNQGNCVSYFNKNN